MTPKPTGFRPDPNKWINTSSSSKSKPPVQRPLVALKHGFMTPTPSRLAEPRTNTPSSTVSKGKGKGKEGIRGGDRRDEQATLGRYMTPPRTAKPKRALERIRREIQALTGPCAGPEVVDERRLKTTEDDWGSDDGPGEEDGPSCPPRPLDIVDLTTQSSPGSSPLSPPTTKTKEDPPQPIPIPSSNLQSQPLKRTTKRPNLHTSVVPTGLMSSSHKTQSPPSELSDPPVPITPVPLSIMAMHQHLCGQDVKKAKEPVLPKSQLKKREIDLRVQNGSRGETVDLVQLSSDAEEDTPGKILSPLRTNTIGSRHLRGTSVGIAHRPKSKVLARYHTSRVGPGDDVPFLMDFAPPLRVVPNVSDPPIHRPSSPTPIRSPTPAPKPTRSNSITPRKRIQHHQITPPKSRERRQMQDQAETLFALPPPPQPKFGRSPPKMGPSKRQRDWDAVEMNPETLLTWSLGGSAGQQMGIDRPDSVEGTGEAPVEGVLRGPDSRNDPQIQSEARKVSPKRARSNSGSPAQSIGPSEPSQSFPILVQSSQPGSSALQQPKSLNQSHPRVDPWSHLTSGILSVPVDEQAKITAKPSKRARESESASTPRAGSQTKLVAFGFFPKHTSQTRNEDKVFETSWEDEQDLDLEVEGEGEEQGEPSTSEPEERLRPVPDAPHHPGLQPAGIRELERRVAVPLGDPARSATNKAAILDAATPSAADRGTSPPLFDEMTPRPSCGPSTTTTPTTSSSLMDDLPGSMGIWWAGIGERDM